MSIHSLSLFDPSDPPGGEEKMQTAGEERYRLIASVISDYVFSVKYGADGGVTDQWIDGAFERITGYAPQEYFDRGGWLSILHPEDREPDQRDAAELFANRQVVTEVRIIRKDGEVRWVRVYAHPQWDEEGHRLAGVYGAVQDITERRRIEDALRASEIRYRAIVQSTTDLICRFLPDTTLTFVNEAYCRYFGKSRDQLVGTRFLALIPEGDWVDVQNHVAMVMRLREPVTYSHEVIMPQGEIRWQQWTDSVILNEEGEIVELQSIGRDITDQKRTGEALKESQRRLSTAMRATKIGVWEWDMRTNKAYWSDENYQVLGLEPGSVEAKYENWAKCVHPDDLPAAEAKVSESMLNRSELNIEFRVVWPDGSIHWINDIGSILVDERGEPLGMYGIQMDVTERKRAEEGREMLIGELEAKNAELERFTYTVSHDLRSPLVTIRGFLGYLEKHMHDGNPDAFRADMERISNATLQMDSLLKDLLELSRIGRLINRPQDVSFGELVRDALEIVRGRLENRGITLQTQPDLPAVHVDRVRLTEVLQNLLDNAAKYMGDQKEPVIEIGCSGRDSSDHFIFFVRDNGIGIAPEYHERIFGLFDKLDASSEGTGVGLALVKRIIEFHGGRVWVESELGRGSTFFFTLAGSRSNPGSAETGSKP